MYNLLYIDPISGSALIQVEKNLILATLNLRIHYKKVGFL
jgi:hypothetical protein